MIYLTILFLPLLIYLTLYFFKRKTEFPVMDSIFIFIMSFIASLLTLLLCIAYSAENIEEVAYRTTDVKEVLKFKEMGVNKTVNLHLTEDKSRLEVVKTYRMYNTKYKYLIYPFDLDKGSKHNKEKAESFINIYINLDDVKN